MSLTKCLDKWRKWPFKHNSETLATEDQALGKTKKMMMSEATASYPCLTPLGFSFSDSEETDMLAEYWGSVSAGNRRVGNNSDLES